MTVSVIDGSTCSAANTTGCGQMPLAILVSEFPSAAAVFIPIIRDSDVAMLDGNICTARMANGF